MPFQKGNTLDKAGINQHTPKPKKADLVAWCKRESPAALRRIKAIARDMGNSAATRLNADQYLVDRAHGRPQAAESSAGGMFQGAQIVVNTGFQDAPTLPVPMKDVTPVNGTTSSVDPSVESDEEASVE